MQARQDLAAVTAERDKLLVIVEAAFNVVTTEQFAEIRRQVAARDREAGSQ